MTTMSGGEEVVGDVAQDVAQDGVADEVAVFAEDGGDWNYAAMRSTCGRWHSIGGGVHGTYVLIFGWFGGWRCRVWVASMRVVCRAGLARWD